MFSCKTWPSLLNTSGIGNQIQKHQFEDFNLLICAVVTLQIRALSNQSVASFSLKSWGDQAVTSETARSLRDDSLMFGLSCSQPKLLREYLIFFRYCSNFVI